MPNTTINTISVKAKLDGESRRFTHENANSVHSFQALQLSIANLFPVLKGREFSVKYVDDENEEISCCSSSELQEAIGLASAFNMPLKVLVYVSDTPASPIDHKSVDEVTVTNLSSDSDEDLVVVSSPEEVPITQQDVPSTPYVEEAVSTPYVEAVEHIEPSVPEPQVQDKKEDLPVEEKMERLICLVIELVSDQAQRQDVIKVVQTALLTLPVDTEEAAKVALAKSLAVSDLVANSELVTSFWGEFEPKIVKAMLCMSKMPDIKQKLQEFLPMISMLLPLFLTSLPEKLSATLDDDETPEDVEELFGALLPPHLAMMMAMSMGGADCFDDKEEQQEDGAQEEAPAQQQPRAFDQRRDVPWMDRLKANAYCDGCSEAITGTRFMCLVCPDYDLCASCEAKIEHDPEHPLMKAKVPFETVHDGIKCDGCAAVPIMGVRYKCPICADYDLCASCEAKDIHAQHPLVKMKTAMPRAAPQQHCSMGMGGRHPHGMRGRFHGRGGRGHGMMGGHGGFMGGGHRGGPLRAMRQQSKKMMRQAARAFDWRKGDTSDQHKHEHVVEVKPTMKRGLKVTFTKDVTLPDNVITSGNQTIVKTWELFNKGRAWPQGSKLIFLRGDREISAQEEFSVQEFKEVGPVQVSAVILTPAKEGKYQAYFSLADENRDPFGPRLWVIVEVQANEEAKSAAYCAPVKTSESSYASTVNVPKAVPVAIPVIEAKQTSSEVTSAKFPKQMELLSKMGFEDVSMNEALLELHKGNISGVLEELVGKN